MRLPGKSAKQKEVEISDFYAFNIGAIWRGFKQQSAAFWFLCVYVLFEYVRPQTLYPVVDILPWTQIALMMALVMAFLDRNAKWVSNPGNALLMTFFALVLVSCALAFRPATAWAKIDIIINWVVLYFLVITVVNTEKRFFIFLLVFFLVNFKMSQFGFRSFIVSGGYSKFGVSGSPGWFKDSGDLGIQMTIFVPLVAAFILALQSYWGLYKKLFFYLLPFTGLITIIATTSRGAQLGMATAGLWFLVLNRQIKVIVAIAALGLSFYALLPDKMLTEYEGAGTDATSRARLALWGYGMDVMREFPVLGVGYYNWLDYCWFQNPNGIGEDVDHCLVAHNTYVTAVAEIGITGLLLYITIMLFIFVQNARTRANARKVNNKFVLYMAHGLDGGLVGYMVATFFFSVLFYPMVWVQLAMSVALREISNKQLTNGT